MFDFFAFTQVQSQILATRDMGRRTDTAIDDLEARVHILEQSLGALWALLKEKSGLTDDELIEHLKKVADAAPKPGFCPECGRRLLTRHGATCSWCGHRLDPSLLISARGWPVNTSWFGTPVRCFGCSGCCLSLDVVVLRVLKFFGFVVQSTRPGAGRFRGYGSCLPCTPATPVRLLGDWTKHTG